MGGEAEADELSDPIVALFKIGKREHMRELVDGGHLYLNTLGYFKQLEDGSPRSDQNEATAFAWQIHGYTIDLDDGSGWQRLGTADGAARFHDTDLERANVFCLYSRRRSQCSSPWRMADLGFGEAFVVFTNPTEFFKRVEAAARAMGHLPSFGPVEYVDRYKFQGPMGAFRKFSEREGESEFRIALTPGTGGPLSLRLGSLRDVAIFVEDTGRVLVTPHEVTTP